MSESKQFVFKERFSILRGKKTQLEFAEFLGISRASVSFYEKGDRVPDAIVLAKIALKCNVSADWLLGLTDNATSDISLKGVCKYMGLSENSIEHLVRIAKDSYYENDFVDKFFESSSFSVFIHDLYHFYCSSIADYIIKLIWSLCIDEPMPECGFIDEKPNGFSKFIDLLDSVIDSDIINPFIKNFIEEDGIFKLNHDESPFKLLHDLYINQNLRDMYSYIAEKSFRFLMHEVDSWSDDIKSMLKNTIKTSLMEDGKIHAEHNETDK